MLAPGPAAQRVAVIGCGPVGLMAVFAARRLARFTGTIIAVDSVKERLDLALKMGATAAVDLGAVGGGLSAAEAVRAAAGGDIQVALEVVGAESAVRLAFDVLRPGGTLSSVGVCTSKVFPFSPTEAYNKNLTLRTGRCPARSLMPGILDHLAADPSLSGVLQEIITHRIALDDIVQGYKRFEARTEGCVKTVIEFK